MTFEGRPRVAPKAHACVDKYNQVYRVIAETDSLVCSTAGDPFGRFKICAGNIGALQESSLSSSLDNRLREAPKIVAQIIELLDDLQQTLREGQKEPSDLSSLLTALVFSILSRGRPNRVGCVSDVEIEFKLSSNGSETSTSQNEEEQPVLEIYELLESSGDAVTNLFRISALIGAATTRDRYTQATNINGELFDPQFDISHVGHKFPIFHETEWLQRRLGKAITRRRQYLRYCRQHRDRLAKDKEVTEIRGNATKEDEGIIIIVEGQRIQVGKGHSPSSQTPSTLAPTTTSTLMAIHPKIQRRAVTSADRDLPKTK